MFPQEYIPDTQSGCLINGKLLRLRLWHIANCSMRLIARLQTNPGNFIGILKGPELRVAF